MASAPVLSRAHSARPGALRVRDRDEIADIVAVTLARHPGPNSMQAMVHDCADALDLLDAVWEHLVDALAGAPCGSTSAAGDIELLSRVKSAITRLHSSQADKVDTTLTCLREAIADLGDIDNVDHLLHRAAVATTTLGFDRAMISSVRDGRWVPVAGHIERDPGWAAEIVAAGQSSPEIIDAALPEAEMVRRRRPILVEDVGTLPRCFTTVIDASKGQRYVAAPILADRSVVGFVHADVFYRARRFTADDLHLLGLFGEFLGGAVSRLLRLDELRALRAEVDGVATRITELERAWSGQTHPSAPRRAGPATLPTRSARSQHNHHTAALNALTRRELEVLELVADGATNRRIARVLTISEGTVKGHLKHIFRKLGTANRAETVSAWLRLTA